MLHLVPEDTNLMNGSHVLLVCGHLAELPRPYISIKVA